MCLGTNASSDASDLPVQFSQFAFRKDTRSEQVVSPDSGLGSEDSSDSVFSATFTDRKRSDEPSASVDRWLQANLLTSDGYQRSSSLKAPRSEGSLNRRKKAVRFADALGLDLEEVKLFIDVDGSQNFWGRHQQHLTNKTLQTTFHQSPRRQNPDFLAQVSHKKVCLENVSVNGLAVTGTVRVANMAFEKQVRIRYTTDCWKHSATVNAVYVTGSSECGSDAFAFTLLAPLDVPDYSVLEFCVCYNTQGNEYWDNNGGKNYQYNVIPEQIDLADVYDD